jgi:hypothetical protein
LQANSEDIRKFFSDVGGVASIRILHDRNTGKSRVSLSLSLSLSLSNTHTRKQRRHTSFPLVISAFPFALDFLYVLSEIYKILATSAVMESALW